MTYTTKQIEKRLEVLRDLKDRLRDEIETLECDLQDYHDERSDTWQESEKGEYVQEFIGDLESLTSEVNDIDVPSYEPPI